VSPERASPPGRPQSQWRFPFRTSTIATVVFGIFVGVVLTEALFRIIKPRPPVQLVRGYGLHTVDGVPVWEYTNDRYNRACVEQHPERTRILFFGSSITFGSGLTPEETFTTALEARLNQRRPTPGFCVLNFAQAGFSFEQKYVVARKEVARYKPALIMWEDWVEWMDYSMIGEAAYGTTGYFVRPDGFIGMAGVPDAPNRILFLHSRLYEYLTLTLGERVNRPYDEASIFANSRLIQVPQLAQSAGTKLVLYLAPPLDRPFTETASSLPDWHEVLIDFGQKHGVPVYPLQRELVEHDYLELRMDPCCHYSAAGHEALVPVMERIILEQLDGGQASPSTPRATSTRYAAGSCTGHPGAKFQSSIAVGHLALRRAGDSLSISDQLARRSDSSNRVGSVSSGTSTWSVPSARK
jgi:hypothetical protein